MLANYVQHFHHERNHQWKGNVLLFSMPAERGNGRLRLSSLKNQVKVYHILALSAWRRGIYSATRISVTSPIGRATSTWWLACFANGSSPCRIDRSLFTGSGEANRTVRL